MQLSGSIVGKNAEPPCLLESDSEAPSLARQDRHAFASLYELCRDDVFRYALRCLGNWDDAADATQTVQAKDAVLIDTTYLTQAEQVERIVALARAASNRTPDDGVDHD